MGADNSNIARIQFLIPTLNNVDIIDETIKSVRNQDYDKEQIYLTVMDFGSTDGTFEKLQKYSSYHMGVYQNRNTKNSNQMIARMAEVENYVNPGGNYCFMAVLYPGDVAYPDFAKTCSDALINNQAINPEYVICESDILDEFGNKRKQQPLFDQDCILNGYTQTSEYVKRGYRHQIQCMKRYFSGGLYRENFEYNESRWWNKCARRSVEKMVVYIKKPLMLERMVKYPDELQEILLRWESLIITVRTYESKYGKGFDDDYVTLGSKNLAEYAIWRSFLICDKNLKESEDCFLISGAIDPEIKNTIIYIKMQELLKSLGCEIEKLSDLNGDSLDEESAREYLKAYFDNNGMR